MQDPLKAVIAYQRTLFRLLDEFFVRATGKSATEFSTINAFGDVVRRSAHEIAPRGMAAFRWLDKELRKFYSLNGIEAFRSAKQLGGMKLVLGGNSRFGESQLASVSTSVLYSDTVLIPDPVMPWLEKNRLEERFRHALLLQAVHAILHLKPLIDADLQYPAVLVFPSWEKLLEDKDQQTKDAISQLVADVFSNFLSATLESADDVWDYADREPDRFLAAVDTNRLFIAPGGPLNERLSDALDRYQKEMEISRSQEWLRWYKELPIHQRVLNGIMERLAPLHHLLENSEEFRGHPLMCLEQHAHYYKIISATNSARLERLGVLDSHTKILVDALGSRRLRWLGGIPVETLAKLRQDNENSEFKKLLYEVVGRLHASTLGDLEKVAAEICQELASAIADHERQLRAIREKYRRMHGESAFLSLAAAGVALIPTLAPFLGAAAPLALAGKYGRDKVAELAEKRTLAKSLMGILASIRRENDPA